MNRPAPAGIFRHLSAAFVASYDFYAELALPSDEAAAAIQEYLAENKFKTTLHNNINLSTNHTYSLGHTVFRALPSRIYWETMDAVKGKTILKARYCIPLWPQLQLCFILFLLWLLLKHFSTSEGFNFAEFVVRITGLILLGLLVSLSSRYRRFGENLFKRSILSHNPKVYFRPLPAEDFPRRILVEPHLFILCAMIQFPSWSVYFSGTFPQNFYVGACIVFIGLFFYFAIKSMTGHLSSNRILPLGIQLMLLTGFIIVIFLLPNGIHTIMQRCSESNIAFQQKSGTPFDTAFLSNLKTHPQLAEETRQYVRGVLLNILTIQIMLTLLVAIMFCFITFFIHHEYTKIHNKNIARLYTKIQASSLPAPSSRTNQMIAQFASWFFYIIFSCLMWYAVYQNISIITALVFPKVQCLHFGYGTDFLEAGKVLINVWLKGTSPHLQPYIVIALFFPMLCIFGLFFITHIIALVNSFTKYSNMPILTSPITQSVLKVSSRLHISEIICKCACSDSTPSPYAAISGFKPRYIIVFPKHCLEFLEQSPSHAEAVIAHEIAHLQNDCRQFRMYSLVSRLGLLGPGIFTVFHNSAAIEELANRAAYDYLEKYDMDPAILDEVLNWMNNTIDAQKCFGKNNVNTIPIPSTQTDLSNSSPWKFWWHYFIYMPRIIYEFYFNKDMYDYVHPRIKTR